MNAQRPARAVHHCDRCGAEMIEFSCKISCPNCGNRFDCSDLTVYMTPIPEKQAPQVADERSR